MENEKIYECESEELESVDDSVTEAVDEQVEESNLANFIPILGGLAIASAIVGIGHIVCKVYVQHKETMAVSDQSDVAKSVRKISPKERLSLLKAAVTGKINVVDVEDGALEEID